MSRVGKEAWGRRWRTRASLSRSGIGEGQALAALLRELDEADFHLPCLHGRVVVLEVPLLELEGRARESFHGN